MTDDRQSTRRGYLRAVGATAVAAALAGCGGGGPAPTTRGETTAGESPADATTESPRTETTTEGPTTDATTEGPPTENPPSAGTTGGTTATTNETVNEARFETVVNVADAGADPSGEEPVNPLLDERVGDDTLLYFPPGRYRLDPWEVVGYRNLGVVGEDAALVPPAGERGYWLMFGDLRDFAFAGFTLDCTARGVAPVNHVSVVGGSNVVRDVTLRGRRRVARSGFEIAAADQGASLLFENVALPDGSTGANAIFVFPKSVGELTLRNCRIEHWAEGLYGSYHSGPMRVLGGYYANNGRDQVRVGGGTSGALVRGVTVRVDDPRRTANKPNMRGIWMEEGAHVRIENCDVAITDLSGTYSSGAIVVGKQFGSVTVRNTRVRTDADAPAMLVREPVDSMRGQRMPSMSALPDDWRVTCRDLRVSGTASRGTAIRVIGRDDCLFERVCVRHSRGARDGVRVARAAGCAVRDSTLDVSGQAISTEDATVTTTRVRTDGPC